MVVCSGPSGSGKQQHIRLDRQLSRPRHRQVESYGDNDEAFRRQLGIALTAGRHFLVFDEIGKTPQLATKIKPILEISDTVDWRPLYENRLVKTPVRAAFYFPCVGFPDFLVGSAEFNRRTRHIHLHFRLPDWVHLLRRRHGELADRTEANARVANSILTHIARLCNEYGYHFDS